MSKPNLIEYVYHKGTYYEKRYLLTSDQATVIQGMIQAAEELRAWTDDRFYENRTKKQSLHGLANRMLRTAREMTEDFHSRNTN